MKVLSQDKRAHTVKLRTDTLDDLWHLSHIIEPGDLVRGKTQRRQEDRDDMVRDTGGERITITLGVRVESVEFHENAMRLRVLGVIEEAPEEVTAGSHHTIQVAEHDWLEVVKPEGWPQHLLERVEEAVGATKEPRITIVAMDDDEGTVAVLYQFGVREIGTKRRSGGGKQYKTADDRREFFAELREVLATSAPEGCPVVVVGPGFARENFVAYLKENRVERVGTTTTEPASHSGIHGVNEALRRGVVQRVAKESRLAKETEAVEELMGRIGKGEGLATYGPDEVRQALNMGAVETLLVLDTEVRQGLGRTLLDLAHQTGAEALVVGSGHEAGRRLEALTGIGALLRFKV